MKALIEVYGKTIAEAVVTILILSFVFSMNVGGTVGFYNKLGSELVVDEVNLQNGVDKNATSHLVSVKKPKLQFVPQGKPRIYSGRPVNLKTYFKMTDSQTGTVYECQTNGDFKFVITSITDKNNANHFDKYNSSTGIITFPAAGVYILDVTVYDSQNQYTRSRFTIPVDQEF